MRVSYTYGRHGSEEQCAAYTAQSPDLHAVIAGVVVYAGRGVRRVVLSERVPGEGTTEWAVQMGLLSDAVPAQQALLERIH